VKSERGFLATMSAIAWSFVGLRRKKDFDLDNENGTSGDLYLFGQNYTGIAQSPQPLLGSGSGSPLRC
jgi:hypothetical protein